MLSHQAGASRKRESRAALATRTRLDGMDAVTTPSPEKSFQRRIRRDSATERRSGRKPTRARRKGGVMYSERESNVAHVRHLPGVDPKGEGMTVHVHSLAEPSAAY
jgi:hypothetical protein